jgi:hypothetical protein
MELLTVYYSSSSCHFLPPRTKHSPQELVLKDLHLCSFLKVRGPYKTRNVLYALVYIVTKCLEARIEESLLGNES